MSDRYVLGEDGKTPVPAGDLIEWAKGYEKAGRAAGPSPGAPWAQVASTRVSEGVGVRVSTVFLGLDHRFGDDGPPLVFETMIFGGTEDQYQERYSTWEEAEAGHAKAVQLAETALAAGFCDVARPSGEEER